MSKIRFCQKAWQTFVASYVSIKVVLQFQKQLYAKGLVGLEV